MGSAAVRYLSQSTPNIAIIGPDEPTDYAKHDGVFASHYDEGRLTHRLSKDLTWAKLTTRAIDQYKVIEQQSGIDFHVPVGALIVGRPQADNHYLAHKDEIAHALHIPLRRYADGAAIAHAHPMLAFPADYQGIFEGAPAGYISPRRLIQAQLAIASQQGATVVRQVVVKVEQTTAAVKLTTDRGATYMAQRVLIANGAFTNCFDLLPRRLALRIKNETTLHAQVPEHEAQRLTGMPTVGYEIESPMLNGIYMAPPIRYPDGKYYIKLGCDTSADQTLPDYAAMMAWMQHGDSDRVAADIRDALLMLIPGLEAHSFSSKRCLVTYTPHSKPYVDQIDERLFIATGGNGSSAKCSDTLGFLAAQLLRDQAWPPDFERYALRVIFAQDEPAA